MKRERMAEASVTASDGASRSPTEVWRGVWRRFLQWKQRSPRRLKLCETLALGERRFVAVVEFEQARFLVGGTAGSLVLLARLDGESDVFQIKEKENEKEENENKKEETGGTPCQASRAAW